jgi:hypothetical protein
MATDDLRDALLAVSGVAAAHVAEGGDATPVVRVWLDGTRPEAEVSVEIDDVIARRGFRGIPGQVPPTVPEVRSEPALSHPPAEIARVAIEETQRGLAIRVTADDGAEVVESIRHGSLATDEAIVAAVASLAGRPAPRLVSVEDRHTDGSVVVVVLVEGAHGRRWAGAGVVVGGRPYAVAKAVHAALTELG